LKFRYPLHNAALYQDLYDNAAVSTWPADVTRPDWDLIIGYTLKQLPQGGRVLDFGCYSGGLLARLGSGYQRYGVEINRAAAAIASETAHVWSCVDDIPRDLRFDVVIAADVVEHMVNPMDIIEELTTLLTHRGILIITTGDADNSLWNRFGASWWYCFYPEHVAFVSKAWLDYLTQVSRLSVIRCETFRSGQIVAHHFVHTALMYCYGWYPSIYIFIGGLLKKMFGRPSMTSAPGRSVSADHLFIVLARKVAS
jgi:SAM-dependent methyltransferase